MTEQERDDLATMRGYLEKVRYKWRRRRTIVRFVVLTIERRWARGGIEPPERPGRCKVA